MIITHSKNFIKRLNSRICPSRENKLFVDQEIYNTCINSISIKALSCPHCCQKKFIYHGSYDRGFSNDFCDCTLISVTRILCTSCMHTQSLLLSPMVPCSRYSIVLSSMLESLPVYHQRIRSELHPLRVGKFLCYHYQTRNSLIPT